MFGVCSLALQSTWSSWLVDNALDRESSGKGATPGQSRVKDVFSYSESTVVQTH